MIKYALICALLIASCSDTQDLRAYNGRGPYMEMRRAKYLLHATDLCAQYTAPWMMPHERVIFRIESIDLPDRYLYDDHMPPHGELGKGYIRPQLKWRRLRSNVIETSHTIERLANFSIRLTKLNGVILARLKVQNNSEQPIGPIRWRFCVITYETDLKQTRFSNDKTIREDWSRDVRIGVQFDRSRHKFYQPTNKCIHADPELPAIQPGETAVALGRVTFN